METDGALILVAMKAGQSIASIEERDDAIRAARAEGHSLRQIAAAANLSHGTVATITRTNPKETR